MAKTKTKVENEVKEEIVEQDVITEETVQEVEEVCTGVVIKCTQLNIRKKPIKDDKKAPVVEVVKAGDKLTIDKEGSTDQWYKVTTASGKKGFCMKDYVKID